MCAQQPDVVILCTSILSLEGVLRSFPVQRLRRSTLVADVLSVKVFPKNLFLATLPPSLDIVCLHPMFGPESGKGSWNNLPLVFDRVRVRHHTLLLLHVCVHAAQSPWSVSRGLIHPNINAHSSGRG